MTPDNSILVQAGLAFLAMGLVAALGVLWHLHTKVTEMWSVLCSEEFGVVTILKDLSAKVDALGDRVGKLERRRA